jgi:hypothetical protein
MEKRITVSGFRIRELLPRYARKVNQIDGSVAGTRHPGGLLHKRGICNQRLAAD